MPRLPVAFALVAALAFGAGTPVAKWLLGTTDPWVLAGLMYLGAGIGLAIVRWVRPAPAEAPLRRRDLPALMVVIGAGGVLGPLLMMWGLARTDAASASLVLNLEAIATLAIAWVVFRESVDRRLFVGAMAIVAGAAVVGWSGPGTWDRGALLVAGACLCWGIDNNASRELSHADPLTVAMIKGLVAGTANLAMAALAGAPLPAPAALAFGAALGAVTIGASLVLYLRAMRDLGAARTAAYFSVAPFAGAVIAVAAFGAPWTWRLTAAAGLMALGLWIHLTERHEHEHRHLELDHEHRHVHDAHHRHRHGAGDSTSEPHSHVHRHEPLVHRHTHTPDLHHRHGHRSGSEVSRGT